MEQQKSKTVEELLQEAEKLVPKPSMIAYNMATTTAGDETMRLLVQICDMQQEEIQNLKGLIEANRSELEYHQSKIDQLFNPGKKSW